MDFGYELVRAFDRVTPALKAASMQTYECQLLIIYVLYLRRSSVLRRLADGNYAGTCPRVSKAEAGYNVILDVHSSWYGRKGPEDRQVAGT